MESPTRSVPDWMSTVATAPRPLSSFASMAMPRASLFGLERRSRPASAVSSTASTHGGARLVTRGVDEGDGTLDALVLRPHLVRTDVLGDAAGFSRNDVRVADGVEEARLTVVDVA